MFVALTLQVAHLLTERLDEVPVDKDVKAGWTALIIFLLLIGAVVVLAFSFVKQMRKTETARRAGVFGPVDDDSAPAGPQRPRETDADVSSDPRQAP